MQGCLLHVSYSSQIEYIDWSIIEAAQKLWDGAKLTRLELIFSSFVFTVHIQGERKNCNSRSRIVLWISHFPNISFSAITIAVQGFHHFRAYLQCHPEGTSDLNNCCLRISSLTQLILVSSWRSPGKKNYPDLLRQEWVNIGKESEIQYFLIQWQTFWTFQGRKFNVHRLHSKIGISFNKAHIYIYRRLWSGLYLSGNLGSQLNIKICYSASQSITIKAHGGKWQLISEAMTLLTALLYVIWL